MHKQSSSNKKISKISLISHLIIMMFFAYINIFAHSPANAQSFNNQATAIRTALRDANVYRLVIETTKKPVYKAFTLVSPNRIVVDINDTGLNQLQNNTLKIGKISAVRKGIFNNTKARFVLEANGEISIQKTMLLEPGASPNWRIVVDFSIDDNGQIYQEPITTTQTSTQQPKEKELIAVDLNAKKRDKFTIVIDPGHGGKDPGAIGVSGMQEKTIVLATAKMLRDELRKNPKYKVIMTRDTDVFLPLGKRSSIAEKNNADLFISIHADSHPKKTTRGLSVYTLSDKATDAEAKKLSDKENASDLIGISEDFNKYNKDVKNILGDIAQSIVKEASVIFGDALVKEINKTNKVRSLPNRPLREAPFYVLKSSVPSALVELGYMSNKTEESLLKTNAYRKELVTALVKAIDKVLQE